MAGIGNWIVARPFDVIIEKYLADRLQGPTDPLDVARKLLEKEEGLPLSFED
jgi:hypothetical protein